MSMNTGEAYTYCHDMDMGLAMWDTADSYEDIKYLSTTGVQADLWTALGNEDGNTCGSAWDCDNDLMWRQTQTGPREYFQYNKAYHE